MLLYSFNKNAQLQVIKKDSFNCNNSNCNNSNCLIIVDSHYKHFKLQLSRNVSMHPCVCVVMIFQEKYLHFVILMDALKYFDLIEVCNENQQLLNCWIFIIIS